MPLTLALAWRSDNASPLLAKFIGDARLLPHVRAISEVESDWTPELVQKRSVRLAELAWDRLAPWLGIS